MIVMFTDFGVAGPYMGEMRAVLYRDAPGVPVVDLMTDAPKFNPRASSYLLPAVADALPDGFVCLAVVDPGVGGTRRPVILRCGEKWYVGPENGLLEMVARRAGPDAEWWEITWRPDRLSTSFHGRDLFAPVAARLARGGAGALSEVAAPLDLDRSVYAGRPDDLDEVIYIDGYGNCMLGARWNTEMPIRDVVTGTVTIEPAATFSDVSTGAAFCYRNAIGLVEIAVNQGDAASQLGLQIGSQVAVRKLSGK